MSIKVGDKLPNATFRVMTAEGPNKPKSTDDIFKGKKVALFAVPGAFTPTCSNLHLPCFLPLQIQFTFRPPRRVLSKGLLRTR